MTDTVIEVFADIVCPFAHVGLQRWVQRRQELGRDDVRLRVRAWPLEIVNGEPMDAAAVAHKVTDLRRQVAPALFVHFDQATFPASSLPALALTSSAYRQGVRVGEAMALRLRRRLFDEGADIADPAELNAIATELGVGPATPADAAAVLADHAEGLERGVLGSPYFFTPDGSGVFCPVLDIRREADDLHIDIDQQHFGELIAACFG